MMCFSGPQVVDRKSSFRSSDGISKLKAGPADPISLYMMYQQQYYINSLMKDTKEKVLSEGKVSMSSKLELIQKLG